MPADDHAAKIRVWQVHRVERVHKAKASLEKALLAGDEKGDEHLMTAILMLRHWLDIREAEHEELSA